MQSITALVHDDPYLRMTPRQRVEEMKRRRRDFYGERRRTIDLAPQAIVAPIDTVGPQISRWIKAKEETFSEPWLQVMWFFDLVSFVDAPPRPPKPKYPRIELIQSVVARHYNVSRHDILAPRRTAVVVRPRQVAMYLAKAMTLRSLPEIGRRFGGRDHTTVLHAVRKIERLISCDESMAEELRALQEQIEGANA
jgi:hypothetical protein